MSDDPIIMGDIEIKAEHPVPALVCPVQVPARIADLAKIDNLAEVFGSPKSVFVGQVIEGIGKSAEAEAAGVDVTTEGGRKKLHSIAYEIARAKAAIDMAGKALNEEKRAEINAVDAERRMFRHHLEELQDEIKAPALEWEAAEARRVDGLNERLRQLEITVWSDDLSSIEIQATIDAIEGIAIDETWQDFETRAAERKASTLTWLREKLARALEREEKDRQLKEAQARLAEIERQERERKAEEERQKRAQEAEERRQREAKAREEELARAKEEAAEKERQAAADRIAAAERAQKEAEARAEEAAAAERARIAEEERKAKEEAEQRAADVAYRNRVVDQIAAKVLGIIDDAVAEKVGKAELAKRIALNAMAGSIPHVEVKL